MTSGLAVGLLASGVMDAAHAWQPAVTPRLTCATPVADGHEPRCNPALAQSPWAAAHRGSYAQASSPFPGPRPGQRIDHRHTRLPGSSVPIALDFSEPYPDGKRVVWGSVVSAPDNQGAFKLDPETGQVIDFLSRPNGQPSSGTSGAYNVLDRDNHLIVARSRGLEVFADAVRGDRRSKIALLKAYQLDDFLCRADDRLVGITMTYDGLVAFASKHGVVGVVPRQPERMTPEATRVVSLNGDACRDPGVPAEELEQVSNSIAADENGGVYVVTSAAQHKLRWNGRALARVWRAEYQIGGSGGGARLGAGSGSTPTLMGTAPSDDKFVVITDGQDLMHLVLLWRDEIPADWKPIAPGKDRRIACETPVRFGDPDAAQSLSEQSVLVRGNAAVVVNNAHTLDPVTGALPEQLRPGSVLLDPLDPPRGIERIDWDPTTRACRTVWANPEISIPNGIPTMSADSGLVYGIGLRRGVWGLRGVDFATGAPRLWSPVGPQPTENSFFAATEVGPGGSVWTGTLWGVTSFTPRQ